MHLPSPRRPLAALLAPARSSHVIVLAMALPSVLALAGLPLRGQAAQASAQASAHAAGGICRDSTREATAPSRDLYCMELAPVPELEGVASGVAELGRVPTPFGAAVTADGRPRYRLALDVSGLPSPSSLGRFTTYVAWAVPPSLAPQIRLGEVRNGRTELGEVALNKFFVWVSAESTAAPPERSGRLVLRGLSPSTRMLADAHLFPAGDPRAAPGPEHGDGHAGHEAHEAHEGHEGHDGMAMGWTMPPAEPRVATMPMPGLEGAVPDAAPFLPGRGIDPATLPAATPRRLLDLRDGDTLRLVAGLVRRSIKGRPYVAYAFNGQIPGPLVRVPQGATIVVDFTNRIDLPTSVHWHGVRLDNASDGVPHLTQEPVPPGGRFRYHVHFRDAGIYWYHPHHREDIQQDLGLYGNLLVASPRPDYYGPAHRDEVLMLDDLLVGDAGPVPYGAESATHAIMGRFGNVLLVNGEPAWALSVRSGEVVRFHLTNASDVRTFNVSFPGARMKVVATDVGRFEREEWVESVVIAPAERYVVEARFDRPGDVPLVNRVQALDHTFGNFLEMDDTLGTVHVAAAPATPDLAAAFATLRAPPDVAADIERYRAYFDRPPEKELVLTLEDRGIPFALEQLLRLDTNFFNPVEWAGTMPMMDWLATAAQAHWVLREPATGREDDAISWRFRTGDVVRLRLKNEREALHAMQHPIHIHGQRFLVLAVNGVPNTNLAWKDTVLVPAGATVDLLLELSNPGRWMLHCHVAEHMEAGMHFAFEVQGNAQ